MIHAGGPFIAITVVGRAGISDGLKVGGLLQANGLCIAHGKMGYFMARKWNTSVQWLGEVAE